MSHEMPQPPRTPASPPHAPHDPVSSDPVSSDPVSSDPASPERAAAPSWAQGPWVVFDVETTGRDPETARIVSACLAHVAVGAADEVRTWLVDPGCEIPEEAAAIHGITTARAREAGREPGAAVEEIAAGLRRAWEQGHPVVAFNAVYDLTVLDRERRRHGHEGFPVGGPVIDPYVIDRQVDTYRRGSRTLTALTAHYGVGFERAHDATHDALASVAVAREILRRHPSLSAMSLADLHAAQVRWHAHRQRDFAAYLRRIGREADDVHEAWPQRPVTG